MSFGVLFLRFIAGLLLINLTQSGNNYPIFYIFQGYEQIFQTDLDSEWNVGDAIQQICMERQILNEKRKHAQMSFSGEILFNTQSLSDAGIGSNSMVQITIPLPPIQQILNALSNTNFLEYLDLLNHTNEYKCHDFSLYFDCDEAGNPTTINIFSADLHGSVDFSLFPDTIQEIIIYDTELNGTIDFLHLPRDLTSLTLQMSNFTADFSRMRRDSWPKYMEILFLSGVNNEKSGSLDCKELPRSLVSLRLYYIQHLNHILFHELPSQLDSIHLDGIFLDELDLSESLPTSLNFFGLIWTRIHGEIELKGIQNCTSLQFLISKDLVERFARAGSNPRITVAFE